MVDDWEKLLVKYPTIEFNDPDIYPFVKVLEAEPDLNTIVSISAPPSTIITEDGFNCPPEYTKGITEAVWPCTNILDTVNKLVLSPVNGVALPSISIK